MSKKDDKSDEIVDKLILDIKALVLLSENDAQLSRTVQENIVGSHDEQVSRFMSSIQPTGNTGSRGGQFMAALGELVLACFLTIAGLSLLAPSLMGIQSPVRLLSYFTEIVSGISANSLSNPLIPVLDFLFALMLLLGSFYLLRHASVDLKHAGLSE
ncbi:MAG: hypothetical protein ACYCPP_02205 [Nitrososphaerales archaeon]